MIPRHWVSNFTNGINIISEKAREALEQALSSIDMDQDVASVRDEVIEIMQGICGTSAEGAAMLASEFYEGIREYELGERASIGYGDVRDPKATDGAVRALTQKLVDGKPDAFRNLLLERCDYEIKRAAAQTCLNKGRVDRRRPKFARVPTGIETCDFCLMLASRGFVYDSEETAGINHYHSNCDCRIIPSWKSNEVDGYDPSALYDQWQNWIDEKAKERAERNGTTADEERQKIMDGYGNAAKLSKQRRKQV